jgi:hypothetical protein
VGGAAGAFVVELGVDAAEGGGRFAVGVGVVGVGGYCSARGWRGGLMLVRCGAISRWYEEMK